MKHVLFLYLILSHRCETGPVSELSSLRKIRNMSCVSALSWQKGMKHVLYLWWFLPEGYETCPVSLVGSARRI
jgi:hypothetical protein